MAQQISVVGTGGDYTTIAAWESVEADSDYGVGNPAVAEITGTVAAEGITGVWVRGIIMRAKAGEEPTFSGGSGLAIISGDSTVFIPSQTSISHEINDLTMSGMDVKTTALSIVTTTNRCLFSGLCFARHENCTMRSDNCLSVTSSRAYDATSGADAASTNCTVVQTGTQFGYVRWKVTNCFVFADSGTGYTATLGGSDHNASDDTSSPGANSLDNRTTADFVDHAGGDYRTASGSVLATAGDGGTFIGFLLEESGADHDLLSDDLQSLSQLSTPIVAQEHALLVDDLQSLSQLSTPTATEVIGVNNLLADDLESTSEVGTPVIGQEHIVLANDLESTSSLSTPAVGQEHILLADDLQSLSQLSTPSVVEDTVNELLADDLESTSEIGTTTIAQIHVLLSDSLQSLSSLTTPNIVSVNVPLIEGASSIVINTNGGSKDLYFNGTDYFEVA